MNFDRMAELRGILEDHYEDYQDGLYSNSEDAWKHDFDIWVEENCIDFETWVRQDSSEEAEEFCELTGLMEAA